MHFRREKVVAKPAASYPWLVLACAHLLDGWTPQPGSLHFSAALQRQADLLPLSHAREPVQGVKWVK